MTHAAGFLVFLMACGSSPVARDFAFYHENVMGTSLELRVKAETRDHAVRAEERALREIDRLSALLSNHDEASEFRRWQAGAMRPARVSPALFAMLRASETWNEASGGAFDPRVQVLSRLWALCDRQNRLPTEAELAEARAAIAGPSWRLDEHAQTAHRLTDAPLTLDAIAKGMIVERACEAAMQGDPAILGVLLNVGGDLRVRGEIDRTIGITPPSRDSEAVEPITRIRVRDRAVATSGGYLRGYEIQGRWYSHIIDPRTGQPCPGAQSATVIARSSADADALATILNVVSPQDGLRIVSETPGAECLIVPRDGELLRSPGFHAFEIAGPEVQATAQDEPKKDAATASSDAMELVVDFEIKAPEGNAKRRYRRPYVAIWLDDKDEKPVRNLLLWVSLGGSGPERWLPDLKRWYRGDKKRKETDDLDLLFTVARATRAPGKYSVTWDGKDNHGNPLPPGEYTLNIETAREHGTYQIIRKPLTIADTPFAEELTGNDEIESAHITYRRKTEAAGGK